MMASAAEFCSACQEISRYSPTTAFTKVIVTKGVCHLLHPPASISDPQGPHQGATRTNSDRVVRPCRGHQTSPPLIQTARNTANDSSTPGECPTSPFRAVGRVLRSETSVVKLLASMGGDIPEVIKARN
jgi:hypothetical protein